MTRDDLMPLIREAGFQTGVLHDSEGVPLVPLVRPIGDTCIVELERFAALVAAAEREACAQVCEARKLKHDPYNDMGAHIRESEVNACVVAIRARGAA